jgi:hypothetical protein
LNETGQPIESDPKDEWLSSFIERMLDEEEHSTEDYGWLSPDGTFHEVESIDKIKKTTTYSVVDISEEDISSL